MKLKFLLLTLLINFSLQAKYGCPNENSEIAKLTRYQKIELFTCQTYHLDKLIDELPVIGNVQVQEIDFSECGEEKVGMNVDEYLEISKCQSKILGEHIDSLPVITKKQ